MKKVIFASALLITSILLSACGQTVVTDKTAIETECRDICVYVESICPQMMPAEECQNKCSSCPIDIKKEIKESTDCLLIEQKLNTCFNALTPAPAVTSNNCDAACNNYNRQCLTQVPGANQELFQEGYDSCMELCQDWNEQKIECMATATNCPDMTIICGL